jgi:Protein of unknown function (DUF3574)
MLVLVHSCGEKDADIDTLRNLYKQRFGQESVLRIDTAATASF